MLKSSIRFPIFFLALFVALAFSLPDSAGSGARASAEKGKKAEATVLRPQSSPSQGTWSVLLNWGNHQ